MSKTAAGGFTRTYDWTIAKSATPATQTIAAGTLATVSYGVTVTPNGFSDSDQHLAGTITVSNPNDWQDITATVTDLVDIDGVTCSLMVNSSPVLEAVVTVPRASRGAAGTVTVDYSCTGDFGGVYTGTNTATATWNAAEAHTPNDSKSGDADVAMAERSVNDTIHVTDTPAGGSTVELGESGPWSAGAYTYQTYTAQFGGEPGTCTSYVNTATITGLDRSDSATASGTSTLRAHDNN